MKISEQINELITIPDILQKYGYGTSRNHRIPCPLHHGKGSNFSYNDQVFQCWTCGAKGNSIGLVMQLFGLAFGQALVRINNDFGLGLTNEKPSLKQIAAEKKQIKERKQARLERVKLREEYLEQVNVYQYLQKSIYKHSPTDPEQDSDEWHSIFVYAAQNIGILENWLDENINRIEVDRFG